MMSVSITVSAEPPEGWQELASSRGTFYHDARWVEGVSRSFGYRTHWIHGRGDSGLTAGLAVAEVPRLLRGRRLVSFPFSFIAGPMARSDAAALAVLAAARGLVGERKASRLEVKRLAPCPLGEGYQRSSRYTTYRVSTAGGESALWQRLDRTSVQQRVRKGERAGVEVRLGSSVDDWLSMARLEEEVQRGHGVPAPPRSFFTGLLRDLQQAGLVDLYLGCTPQREVAAGFVMYRGPREWIYAFSAADPRLVRDFRATHVILWAGLRRACEAGVVVDLGRTAPEQASLAEFKLRWGAEPVPLAYDYFPTAGGMTEARRDRGPLALAGGLWSRLPRSLTRLGAGLYRYLG